LSDQSGAESGDTDVHELRLTLLHTYGEMSTVSFL
jgi:hypothetical protein